MRLGILETGGPPAELAGYGSYAGMFRKLLGEAAYDYVGYDVQAGQLPERVDACPFYLVTGSPCGVYEALPWIAELKRFLNRAKGKAALVGICFGHQIIAEAFGGKVVKSPKGWGLGSLTYEVFEPQPWMDGDAPFTLPASHQDQVVEAPAEALVAGGSGFAPLGLLAYPGLRAISMQLHPEFDPAFAAALVERRRGKGITDAEADSALASLQAPNDSKRVAGWIRDFLELAG